MRLCEIYNDKKNQHIIFNFKGVIHLIKNDLELSEQYFIKSTEIQPKYEDPIKNLYLVYLKKKLFNKMLVYAKQLVKINELNDEYKNIPKFFITLLILYSNIDKKEECEKLLNQSKDNIKKEPEFLNYYGLKLLYEGNFSKGWEYYEYRNSKITDFYKDIKEWNGEKINEKSIVVFNEQGIGDSIQFSKYLIIDAISSSLYLP